MGRGERILDAIHDDVNNDLNPEGDSCWHCGGDGYTHDCVDGFCLDAEIGCEDCTRPCPECLIRKRDHAKAVRRAVVESGDVEVAAAWLKEVGRWSDDITMEQIGAELDAARSAMLADTQPES